MISLAEPTYYVEQFYGGVKNRRQSVLGKLKEPITSSYDLYGKDGIVDAYHSVFAYREMFAKHFTDKNSVRGYNGPVYTHQLHWDLDNDDEDVAYSDLKSLLERLDNLGFDEDSIRIFFSGNKGYHIFARSYDIETESGKDYTHSLIKYICSEIAGDLESFDESVYDRTRVIRVANSKHSKTGLYKIPLYLFDIRVSNPKDIKILAKHQRQIDQGHFDPIESEYIAELIYNYENKSDDSRPNSKSSGERFTNIIDGILNGFNNGDRNTGLTSVAGILHSQGVSPALTRALLLSANNNAEQPLSEVEIDNIVDSVSKYPVKSEYEPIEDDDIKTVRDGFLRWKELKKSRTHIDIGLPLLEEPLYTFDPGKTMILAARPGIGKTTLGMHMLRELSTEDEPGLFASLEMSDAAIFYRASQMSSGIDGLTPEEYSNMLYDSTDIQEKTFKDWENVYMIDKSGLTIGQIEAYAMKLKERNNGKLGPVMIDYLGLIGDAQGYDGISMVAREIKNMAKRLNTRVILLAQLSRKAGDGTIPVRLDHLRDSGSIEESTDVILGIWRSSGDQTRLHTEYIKNRDGILGVKSDLIQHGLNYENVEFDDSEDVVVQQPGGGWR